MKKEQSVSPLQENKMGVMPIGKLLFNMAAPMIMSMLVQALYNIIDSVYIAQYSQDAVTALSLAFPVQNVQIGCAVGIGVGVNSMLSKSLGEGNRERANRAAGNGIFLTLLFIVVFMLFGFFGVRPYYEMQSTVEETVEGGIVYTSICCIMTFGIFLLAVFCAISMFLNTATDGEKYPISLNRTSEVICIKTLLSAFFAFPNLSK